jgi:glycosyltransferase involved in cell wall biosynthesis
MPKKVLIITYYWPPAGGIAVVRWVKFVKYLQKNGWTPIVYTVSNGNYPLIDKSIEKDVPDNVVIIRRPIREPHALFRFFSKSKNTSGLGDIKPKHQASLIEKISNWVRGNLFIPDARALWINPSKRFLKNYLKTNPVNAIVSTGPPHSAHRIAYSLKRDLNIPWLADFRDPWTTMDYYKELILTKWADKKHHRFELEVLKAADVVTVIGSGMKKEFDQKRGREVTVITNGFDEDDFALEEIDLDKNFSIVHMGTFFRRVNPINLWKTIAELKAERHPMFSKLKIKLIGRVDPSIVQSIHSFGLTDYLQPISYQPHDEAVRIMKAAQVLLLFVYEPTRFVLTGKLFEYIAARRPVLCVGPVDGDAAHVIEETGAGQTFSFDDINGIKKHLINLYAQFEKGELKFSGNNTEKYSYRQLTKQMAGQLNHITNQL